MTPSQAPVREERLRSMLDDLVHCTQYSDRNPNDGYAKDEIMIARRVIVDFFISACALGQGWQPISTAPRDVEVLIGAWIDGQWRFGPSVQFYEQGNEMEGEHYRCWLWSIDDVSESVAEAPTHWQPLPPPPIEACP